MERLPPLTASERLLLDAIELELQDFFRGSEVERLVELEARAIAAYCLVRWERLKQESEITV